MSSYSIAPPPLTVVGGTTITVTQPQIYNDGNKQGDSSSSSSSSSSSPTSSFIIVVIVIASAIIVSASVYLLLRFISRRFHRSFRTFSAVDDVVPPGNYESHTHNRSEPPADLFVNLPIFTFGSVTGKVAGGDCAVCLSKFESHDQLRLLPLCCHAFHARCIDAWLTSNQTCPLCRSTVLPTDEDVLNKALSASAAENGNDSFRLEIGSISRRHAPSDQGERRSYSIGSFEYIVEDGYEVSVASTHRRGPSDCTSIDKDSVGIPVTHTEPPGERLAAEVSSGRSWLREYVDRFASSISVSSRAVSFRSSGRFFTGSSRRNDTVAVEDIEGNRIGEEISELFRWFSGV